jgi:competence protein ComEA
MNLRLPLVAGLVGCAGVAAAFRGMHPAPSPAAVTDFESPAPVAPTHHIHHSHLDGELTRGSKVVVYVAGEVRRRGVYSLPASGRAIDALAMAGGAADDADLVAVNLAAPLTDGEEIAVPPKGAMFAAPRFGRRTSSSPRSRSSKRGRRSRRPADSAAAAVDDGPAQVVDVNRADENELESLPGIGPALAGRIVEFRETNGPFGSLDDLLDVGGMTQRKLDAMQPYVAVR